MQPVVGAPETGSLYCSAFLVMPHCNINLAPEQEEFRLADEACSALLAAAGRADWAALLRPFPFFTSFKNYLQVVAPLLTQLSVSAVYRHGLYP